MTAALLPLAIGHDTEHPTWSAVWSTDRASDLERQMEQRLGTPTAYWLSAVGYPGQWCWPDGTVDNAQASPPIIERKSDGYRLSLDGGLTWADGTLAPEEITFALSMLGIELPLGNKAKPENTTPSSTSVNAPSGQPRLFPVSPRRYTGEDFELGALSYGFGLGAIALIVIAAFTDSTRKSRR